MITKKKNMTQLDRIEEAIYGNGREGLVAGIVRVQENVLAITDLAKTNCSNISTLAENVERLVTSIALLQQSVETHHKSEHFSELVKKKGFWVTILVGFVSLHLVSTCIPNLWNILVIGLGAPYLKLPLM